jgi:hypothetical protein
LSTLLLDHNRGDRFKIGGSADARTSADFIKTSGLVRRNDVVVRIDFRSSDDRRCVRSEAKRPLKLPPRMLMVMVSIIGRIINDKAIDNRGHRLLCFAAMATPTRSKIRW